MPMQLPLGIPITDDIHEQYTPELKAAWKLFHEWWVDACQKAGGQPVSRASMSADVVAAKKLIEETLIPGYDNATGADSCYMVGVEMNLVD